MVDSGETKSELWNKFYEEEKARLERELLQVVFGNKNTASSSSTGNMRPQTVNNSSKAQTSIDLSLMFGSPTAVTIPPPPTSLSTSSALTTAAKITTSLPYSSQQTPLHQALNNEEQHIDDNTIIANRNLTPQFNLESKPVLSPVEPISNTDKLQEMRNDMVRKWAQEYISSNNDSKQVIPAQRQQILESLMKIRGAVQNEHETLLRSQREALVKQADMELQTLVFQEQVLMERQYRDYVINKLAQHLYNAHQLPVDLVVQKSLEDIKNAGLLSANVPSTLDTYLRQRSERIIEECKVLVDRYVERKLVTAGSVLVQQHRDQQKLQHHQQTSSIRIATESEHSYMSNDNQLKELLGQRMQDTLAQEKQWVQGRHNASSSTSSLRTVEHELWQKAYLAFQKNVTLAGQIALMKQLQ